VAAGALVALSTRALDLGSGPAVALRRIPARLLFGISALAGLTFSGLLIAAGSASRASPLVPASRGGFPGWLRGPFGALHLAISRGNFAVLMVSMTVCYLAVLLTARSIPLPAVLAAIATLHLVFLLSPPLLSADEFGYISFARLGSVHGLNPYLHSATAASSDPAYQFLGWPRSTSPYGPLFTLASYGLAPLSVPVAFWCLKVLATAASLGCTALLWRLARIAGRSPLEPVVLFALNPIVLVWAVGGAHNDLLLMLAVLAGMALLAAGRGGSGLGTFVAACGIKAWVVLVLPFAFIGARGRRNLIAPLLVLCAIAAATFLAFGHHVLGFERELFAEQRLVAVHSVPNQLGLLLGLGGLTTGLRIVAAISLVAVVAALLVRVAHGSDWLTGAGWATLCLLVCSAWLLPWYAVWALPFAALGESGRLRAAALAFTCYVVVFRIPSLL
jgi:alpha-1,6-mannosyltransferase